MVVVNMKGIGKIVDEGDYEVTLTSVTEKKTQAGNDMVVMKATIRDAGGDMDGRSLFRNFVFSNKEDADNSGILYYAREALIAFGGDEDEMDEEQFDITAYGKGLIGNKARAKVTHVPDNREGHEDDMTARVEFYDNGGF